MSIVGVGQQRTFKQYDPAEIVTVLSVRDDLNSDVFANRNRFIFGLPTQMSPGQSMTVTVTFLQDASQMSSGPPPEVFELASEIVVGMAKTGTRKSYTLHNFTFDRVGMRPGGS